MLAEEERILTENEKKKDKIESEIHQKAGKMAECIIKKRSVNIYPSKDGIKVAMNHETVIK